MNQKTKLIVFGIGGLLLFFIVVFGIGVVLHEPPKDFVITLPTDDFLGEDGRKILEENSPCIDSDEKQIPDDRYYKGEVFYIDKNGSDFARVLDECLPLRATRGGNDKVAERFCDRSRERQWTSTEIYDCPNGCYDGRCLKEGEIDPTISSPHLHLLSPKGGESLCIGEEYVIQWEGPKELFTVSLWVYKGMERAWKIEDLPATFNESNTPGSGEYVWKIGTSKMGAIPEGYAYTIGISGNYPQSMHKTNDYFQMDKPFSIINCQG